MKTEVSNIEIHEPLESIFIYVCLTSLSVTPSAEFPVVGFLTE